MGLDGDLSIPVFNHGFFKELDEKEFPHGDKPEYFCRD